MSDLYVRDGCSAERRGVPCRLPGRAALLALALLAACGCGRGSTPAGGTASGRASGTPAAAIADREPLSKGPPAATGFVGSAACTDCHSSECREYRSHPMSRSLTEVTAASPIEDFEHTEFSSPYSITYYVEKTPGGVIHHEKRVDASGEVVYDQGIPVAFAVGSGARGRSYLINDGGRLYASPITWYSQSHRWGFSPGYAPELHARFERRVSDGCVACHAGQTEVQGEDLNRFALEPFVEQSIGCERCHGPGEAHVARHAGDSDTQGPDPIVNPADFSDARRDAVCNQCHLQGRRRVLRYGRSEFDFRPGMALSENWVIFVKSVGAENSGMSAISQVEQMYASRCYKESHGALSCIGCHSGHGMPEPDKAAAFYREKCMGCHSAGKTECSEDVARRQAADDSCIACHMPKVPATDVHAAQTEHRILRRPSKESAAPTPPERLKDVKLVLFEEPGIRIPQVELDRARGIFLAEQAVEGGTEDQAREAIELLLSVMKRAPDDIEGRFALGKAFSRLGQRSLAMQAWDQVLTLQPTHEDALEALATECHEAHDLAGARLFYQRLIEVNPGRSQYYGRLAHVLGQQGDMQKAIAAARRALELNPSLSQTHAWLVEAYERVGEPARAAAHAEKLKQFQSGAAPRGKKTKR